MRASNWGSLATVIAGVHADPQGGLGAQGQDQLNTARLMFDADLVAGRLDAQTLRAPAFVRATRVPPVPARLLRLSAQVRYRAGRLDFQRHVIGPLLAARREALGEPAPAPPRLLVRVDEFPHYRAWDEPDRFGTSSFEHFHEIMHGAGVPYLIAVLPRVSREPLSPSGMLSRPLDEPETAMLGRLAEEGVSFALHGRDHRTRFASARRRSELCGLGPVETERLLEDALTELARHEIAPRVFIPPFNRFDARQFPVLASHFDVVCGGPESIGQMGFQSSPQWRGQAVYLPSYAPFYGSARDVLPAVERGVEGAGPLWVPLVLHWGWEMESGWRDLERLAERVAPYAAHWDELHGAIGRSRLDER